MKKIKTVHPISITLYLLFSLILLIPYGRASDQIPAPPQDHPIALIGGTIVPVNGASVENGTILFTNGKITTIGKNIEIPDNAETIDVTGQYVYPGLIAADTTLGLVEIGAVRATHDYAETGQITPEVRAEVAVNPGSEHIPVTRANGITTALIVPQGGYISGTSALLALDGWTWEDMTIKAPVGMHIRWPNIHIDRSSDNASKAIERREEHLQIIRDAFAGARAYQKAKKAESQEGIPYHDTDIRWESMLPVLNKEIPVFVHAYEIQQIQSAIDWICEEDLKMVLISGGDVWRVTELLKKHDIPVIIRDIYTLPRRDWEPYDTPYTLPSKLYKAGIQFCIAGAGGITDERNIAYEAAKAAAFGLSAEEALKAITLYPAQIVGVADRLGSLETGKDATLIVTNGNVLEITTNIEMEFIQGRKVDVSSKHTQLYAKYLEKYRRMGIIEKE